MSHSWSRWHIKNFLSPPPHHSCLFLVLWFVFSRRLIALTFAGNTCLMSFSVVYVLDFQSLINRLCAKFHIAIFSPSCCLYCLFRTEHSTYFILGKVCHFVGGLKHKHGYKQYCNASSWKSYNTKLLNTVWTRKQKQIGLLPWESS